MATISNTPRPGYVWDSTDNVWYPIGVGAHQHTNAADTPAVMPYSTYAAAGKNKIINGDFEIWQRGTSFSYTSTADSYTADRWRIQCNLSSGTSTVSRQAFTAGTAPVSGYEGEYFLRVTNSAGATNTEFQQRLEDVRLFAGQTVTISFWAKASSAVTMANTIIQNFGSGGSGSVSTTGTPQTLTTSWARYSTTINVPSIAGKTIGADNNLAVYPMYYSSGTIASNVIDIWGVQLEAGSTVTAFQTATGNPASELAACQRYYYRQTSINGFYEAFGFGMSNGTTTAALIQVNLPATMRTAPTSVEYSTLRLSDYGSGMAVTSLSLDSNHNGRWAAVVNAGVASGLTAYRSYSLQSNNSQSGYIGFSAEL
jgi:hypothetical protein